MSIVICKTQPEYAQQIYDIEYNTFSDAYSMQSILESTKGGLYGTSLVALLDGEVVGYIIGTDVAGEAEIQRIAVADCYRNKGWGSALLRRYIDNCFQEGICCIHLEVRQSNTAAISLYNRHGFKEVGVRTRYYGDNGEDAVLYTLTLGGR